MGKDSADDADAWFFNLENMAKRVEANQEQVGANLRFAHRNLRKIYVLGAFLLFAFLLLAWRSEVNADRITVDAMRISDIQGASCRSDLAVLTKFNALQDRLIEIERTNPVFDAEQKRMRIEAYRDARILPLPDCPEPRVKVVKR